jgi:tetratricopeptide (TPR) repeat protein
LVHAILSHVIYGTPLPTITTNSVVQQGQATSSPPASAQTTLQQISQAENQHSSVYSQIRSRLTASQKDALKKGEIEWIKRKDFLSSEEKLSSVQNRIRTLQERYGTGGSSNQSTAGDRDASSQIAVAEQSPQPSRTAVVPEQTPSKSPEATKSFTDAFNRARREAEGKQYEAAMVDYTEAIRLKPDDSDAYSSRASSYEALQQNDKALSDYTEAIRLKPTNYWAYYGRGFLYALLQQYDKAVSDSNEMIRLEPNNVVGYSIQALAYSDLKQYDKAITDYTEAIRLAPNPEGYYDLRGNVYAASGAKSKAEQDHKRAKQLRENR